LPSPSSLRWLVKQEWRELLASRAFWLLLFMIAPLVGHSFITAVNTYAEASGAGGGPAALAQGLSPLDGILVPTFGAYDLAVTLLFPFVAIRLISADKASGAWKLMQQAPVGLPAILLAKGLALLAGWLLAWIPGLLAVMLWKIYGGTLYAPELLNLLLGHLLRVILASGVAVAAASIATNASSAAIATLGFTVGTWALEFIGENRGGLLQKLASYTPTSALRVFEQGQFRLSTAVVTAALGIGGFALAAVWMPLGRTPLKRAIGTLTVAGLLLAAAFAGAMLRPAFDLSENRRNSFSEAEEAALQKIHEPLRVTVFLGPEDPRLIDLDRGVLSKLERILPSVEVVNASHSQTGLFEGSGDRYGEIWYEMGGRRVMSRSTTEPIVLGLIYDLARVPAPAQNTEPEYAGHRLAARPTGAGWIFYLLLPMVVVASAWLHFKNRS
jgi:ABC-2 type transport system permease protein